MSKITKITDQIHDWDSEDRRLLLIAILTQQRSTFKGNKNDYIREHCTLIDLSTGLLVGSGICPKCNGWLGRMDSDVE